MSKRNAESYLEEPLLKQAKMEGSRLQLRYSPISLQHMAAVRVAIALWYHENVRHLTKEMGYDNGTPDPSVQIERSPCHYCGEAFCTECSDTDAFRRNVPFSVLSLREHVEVSSVALKLPKVLEEMIDDECIYVGVGLDKWVNFVHPAIFFDIKKENVYKYVDEIIFKFDGSVNYIETAKHLMYSPRVSEVEKYRIVCTFCLEEQMKTMSPVLFTVQYMENVCFEDHPLIYYFNSLVKGRGVTSIDVGQMLTLKNVENNKYAITYIFNLLPSEEKIEKAKLLLRNHGIKYQIDILNNLNELQQQQLFLDMGAEILTNFAKSPSRVNQALETWIHVRNLITDAQYVEFISNMINLCKNSNSSSHVVSLLSEVWRNSPSHLKRYTLKYEDNKIINKFLEQTKVFPEDRFGFIVELLSDADADTKKKIIQSTLGVKFCELLMEKSRPSLLDRLIKLCLPEVDDVFAFKEQLLKSEVSKKHCLLICISREMDKLDEFFSFYQRDPSTASVYITQLLSSQKGIFMYRQNLDRVNLTSLKTFIAKIMLDANTAASFLREVASSIEAEVMFRNWILNGELDKTKSCVAQLLPNDEDATIVKDRIFKSYQGEKISELFAGESGHLSKDFFLWCLNTEQNVSKFKATLSIQNIFVEMLKKSIFDESYYFHKSRYCKLRKSFSFTALDQFLFWYLTTPEEVKKFKIKQIFQYRHVDIIDPLSKKGERSHLKELANWFFDGDDEQIRRFKLTNKKSPIAKVL